MGEVATVIGGGTPKSDQPEYFGGDIPWITPADLSGYTEKFISVGARSITQAGLDNSGARVMPAGAVLFSSRAPIGYVAIAANPVSTNQGFKTFVLRDGLTSDFVYYYLQHAKKLAVEMASGTTFLEISGKKAAQLPIPIASLPEQRRIVAEIEKQFTRLEAGVAALRRVQANLKRYRAAVLKAACEGRLVPTEAALARSPRSTKNGPPAYETGEALLARILTERRQNWQGRGQYKEPAALQTADLPSLPEGWTWAQFGYLGKDPFNTVQTGPFGAQLHNTEFTESGVPVIAVGNLTGTGFRTDGLYFVSDAKAKQLARYDVWAGDLLFARSGATLGKVCVAPDAVQDWRMTGHILRARLNQDFINPKIAVYALAALPAVRKQVFGNVRGVTRPGFNTGLLESILIPIPPLAEQTRIVAEVERRLSVVEELESVVSANLQRATRLRQSILQRAFTGELL